IVLLSHDRRSEKSYRRTSSPAVFDHDPQPDVPQDRTPTAQCVFKSLTFKASAIHSLLRSSSIHEPSDPPVRLIFVFSKKNSLKKQVGRQLPGMDIKSSHPLPRNSRTYGVPRFVNTATDEGNS